MNTDGQSSFDEPAEINKRLAYVLGELTPAERQSLEDELKSDAAARRELEEFQQLVSAAALDARTAPSDKRSTNLRQMLDERLSGSQPQPAAQIAAAKKRRRRLLIRWATVIGGTACVAGLAMLPSVQKSRTVKTVAHTSTSENWIEQDFLLDTVERPITAQGKPSDVAVLNTDISPAADLDAAAIQVELSDFGSETAPRNDLAKSIGAFNGSGLEGRSAVARRAIVSAPGGRARSESRSGATPELLLTESLAAHDRRVQDKETDRFTDDAIFIDPGLNGRGIAPNAEQYRPIVDNPFRNVEGEQALSTFSVDVDSASYANVRRFLTSGQMPPKDAVRIEELLNYFSYSYPQPTGEHPFSVNMETAACPWRDAHRLVRIGIKGREIAKEKRPPSNLVFLIDVSGSMSDQDKLPLLKKGLNLLVNELTEDDRVTIITYAGDAGERLPPTNGADKKKILAAIESLNSGGSTHGSAGIQLAYEKAAQHFIQGGTNRVLWATDGDLNVGVTREEELVELVKEKAKSGVFVSVLGFGTGNLQDGKLEQIADNGNGIYAYIDSLREARKVLVEQMSGSLLTIAKDVKLQIEFNPAEVAAYRLIGYENRVLATQDFHNDKRDAGDIGAGHTVTALYEIVPAATANEGGSTKTELKYQKSAARAAKKQPAANAAGELLTLKLRYKQPHQNESRLLEVPLGNDSRRFTAASTDFQFASAVAAFGMILRNSPHRGSTNYDQVIEIAAAALSEDAGGYRAEFVDLVRKAKEISR